METIKIQVAKRIATNLTPAAVIVCDNSGYKVAFTFDEEWEELPERIARFTYQRGGRDLYQEQPFEGNAVEVPKLHDIDLVNIGVYAGDICTTTPAVVLCRRSILKGDPVEELPASVRASLQRQIGDLDDLKTKEKGSLVAAINELAARPGGNLTDEQVAAAVAEYLKENPISAGSTAVIGAVELLSANWTGSGNLYSQIVTIDGVTENSQVDLTPSVEQLVVFHEKDLTFVTENDGGTVTVYAIGQRPENDYTIQVTITEVGV